MLHSSIRERMAMMAVIASCLCSCKPAEKEAQIRQSAPVISKDLSNSKVNAIAEDRFGRIWIGTFRGLNKAVGKEYHQYYDDRDDSTLQDNQIKALLNDSQGRLWVASVNGPSLYTDMDSFKAVGMEGEGRQIVKFLETQDGKVLASTGFRILKYDEETEKFVIVLNAQDLGEWTIDPYMSPNGDLWVISASTIRCLNAATMTEKYRTTAGNFFCVSGCMMSDGKLWMSGYGDGGLRIFDTRSRSFTDIPESITGDRICSNSFFNVIYPYSGGVILYSEDNGIYFYGNDGSLMRSDDGPFPFEAPDFKISTFFTDSRGNLWIGSIDQGVKVIYSYRETFNRGTLAAQVGKKSVESVEVDKEGNLWMATLTDGVWVFDRDKGKARQVDLGLEKFKGIKPRSEVQQILCASDGSLWFISMPASRILRCSYKNGGIRILDSYDAALPMSIAEDRDGTIWVGQAGTNVYRIAHGAAEMDVIQVGEGFCFIPGILPLDDGRILVCGFGFRIKEIDPVTLETKDFKPFAEGYGECIKRSAFIPTDAFQDSCGDIWIGTVANGILRYDSSTGAMKSLPGVPCDDIESIEEDINGDIWLGSQHGIGRWERKSGRFTNFYKADGLGGDQFYDRSSCRSPDNVIFFGGTHGLTYFKPEEINYETRTELYFETFKIHDTQVVPGEGCFDKSLELTPDITLHHGQNSFSISFSALEYSEYDRLHYHYIMEGYDRYPNETRNQHEAYYGNLPAGRYTFRVKAMNIDDTTVLAENSINIRVRPPFWLSWWAIILYAAILGTAVTVFRMQILRARKEEAAARKAEADREEERRINRMNMNFFANVSHELRTPLTMIAGPVKLMEEQSAGEQKRMLGIVRRNVHRMLRLVGQMLDFNKLENDTLRLKVSRTDLVPFLKDIADLFAQTAQSKDIQLNVKGLMDSLEAWIDEDKLDKICYNLLSNAVKFTPEGGNIILGVDVEADGRLKLTVSDSGPGIPQEYLEKVFERYFQVDNQTGSYNLGTGIGLYYARALAGIHHGSLTAENRPEGGARFTLRIPVAESAYAESEKLSSGRDPRAFATGELRKLNDAGAEPADKQKTILVVDDDVDVAHYLKELLSDSYNVVCRFTADSAFELMKETAADLVISDVMMPGKSGYELCRMIKGELQISHTPVVLVTAKTAIDDQVEGLNCGADAYVTKPFDPNYLLALVQSQLKNREHLRDLIGRATEAGDIAEGDGLSERDKAFMDELYNLMDSELANSELDIMKITEKLHMSRTKLYYKIKGLTGENPSVFFRRYKLNRAAKLIRGGRNNMSEIADMTGFSSLSHFSSSFKKQFGVSPSEY